MVVVHGGPDFNHAYLLPEMDRLAGSLRLVYYDQRGRGRSFCGPQDYDVTMASEIADLDRVRELLGLRSMAVLGHSWGALLAMEYAIRHPRRVSRLILMNSAPASRADALTFREELASNRSHQQMARMTALRADPALLAGDVEIEAEYYRIHFGTTIQDPDQLDVLVGRLRSDFTAEGIVVARAIEDRLYEQTWSRSGYDLIPALHRLDVATLIIHGDRDFIPLDLVRHVADAIPGARLTVLQNCGHFAHLDQPEEMARSVTPFVMPE
jgi:proline iminopeptidase